LLYRVILSSSLPNDIVLDPFFGSGTTGVVAKKLKRHWIGIEKEAKYLKAAHSRIEATQIVSLEGIEEDVLSYQKKKTRIPFGALLENGLLRSGQLLFFGDNSSLAARILPNGKLEFQGIQGSIHQLAREIQKAPCNGWEHWYYLDEETGERKPIDCLRSSLYKRMGLE